MLMHCRKMLHQVRSCSVQGSSGRQLNFASSGQMAVLPARQIPVVVKVPSVEACNLSNHLLGLTSSSNSFKPPR